MYPTKKGVSLNLEMWQKMIDMREDIQAEIDAKAGPK